MNASVETFLGIAHLHVNRLDLEIRIQVGPRPPSKPQAGITVEAVDFF